MAWLLLTLACLALALAGKGHSTTHEPVLERATLTATSPGAIVFAAAGSDEGKSDPSPAFFEPSAENEPSGDRYRRSRGGDFPALAGLAPAVPLAAVTGDRGPSSEGRLPPAHAPPPAG